MLRHVLMGAVRAWVALVVVVSAAPAVAAISVTFEKIAKSGDPVPGREAVNVVFNGRAFQQFSFTDGVLSRPSMNAGGEVVFRGVSSHPADFNLFSAIGLYVKSPGTPLSVLVDTTTSGGVPVFPVPGQPATTQFTNFKPPLVNDAGDVLFYATYGGPTGGGSGFYAMTTSGGPIVKLVDSSDTVPGFAGTTFSSFAFGGVFGRFTLGSLNDVGQVVFMGVFNAPDDTFIDVGLYGTTVAGGALTRLADATGSMTMIDLDPSITIHGLQQDRHAALNNAGMVVFGADIGPTPFSAQRAILAVPVDGSGGVRTLAKRFDPVVLSDGVTHTLFANFNGHDINDSGQFMFQHAFSPGGGVINALITGDINVAGSPLSVVVDNAGGFAVPQRPGSTFTGIRMTAINGSGQLGFDALTDIPANSSGVYTTDLSGGAVGFVSNSSTAPPGRPGVVFNTFGSFDIPNDGESVVINASGNMALTGSGLNETATASSFGLYFFDRSTGTLERLVDETTSAPAPPVGLGDVFGSPGGQQFFMMWDGSNTRAGHYRAMNDNNDVAFITAFSTFNVGLYVAHVSAGAGGGGGTTIACPADAVVECGASTDPTATGAATAADSCTGASVATTFSDAVTPGTGGTETITRTWSADDGSGGTVSCVQVISVLDTTNPTLSGVPADATAECDAVPAPASPTVSDTCDPAPTLTFAETLAMGACLDEVTLTRTWTGADGSNNTVAASQVIFVDDTVAPTVTCPADLAVSGGFGGTNVAFATSATDNCDPAAGVATSVASGSFFTSGVTSVTAIGMDRCGNAASCSFDVLVSCFGVNRAKIGTKDVACRGIEEIEFTSMNGTEALISLFKAEEGSGGGVEEDTLPASIVVDDGVNGAVTVDTSCAQVLAIGDVFGPYTVTDIEKDHDDHVDDHGNEVELRGSFVPAVPFDLAVDAVVFTIDDGQGHTASFTIPAGAFQVDGNPEKGKFKFEGTVGGADVKAKLEGCKFKFKAKNATNTGALAGTTMTVGLAVGANVAADTLAMEDKGNHLKFKRAPKVNCCPECVGVASMQVTSDQGVLVFEPPAGQTKLGANTVVDDGVNGAVTIHTSCSQSIEVGDVFGAYTISELIKIFETGD
ncbi:MAG: choice-of-anchor tandem repeat NxxGxxAF-containing protein [Phycisphaerae bacterium]